MKECCSVLEPDEKPHAGVIHHEIDRCYQTLDYTCFTQEIAFNMICAWKRGFYAMSYRTFLFVVFLPFSRFFFTHHVDPITEEVELDVKDEATYDFMAIQMYDPQIH